ncbi:hypothetical protein KY310_01090 [Candidatus Woesearchaeota archaeon]|nr:hypothetical protein [Candidatus Woesearchaeota archaeon]
MSEEGFLLPKDAVAGGRIANACAGLEEYRKHGKYGSLVFDHAAGIHDAIRFLENAQSGLFTNVDDDNFRYAHIVWELAGAAESAGGLDLLLSKHISVLEQVKRNETPDPADFSDVKAFLYKLACTLTDLPSIYPGTVKPD